MTRYLRIIRTFMAAEAKNEMAYRVNLVLGIVEMVLVIGTSLGAVLVLFTGVWFVLPFLHRERHRPAPPHSSKR